MGHGEIERAVERLRDRQDAAGEVGPGMTSGAAYATARRMMSGLDIDLAELIEWSEVVRTTSYLALIAGVAGPGQIAAGRWTEGVMIGLLIAEEREREEAGR